VNVNVNVVKLNNDLILLQLIIITIIIIIIINSPFNALFDTSTLLRSCCLSQLLLSIKKLKIIVMMIKIIDIRIISHLNAEVTS